jgi:acetyltransferase-like isoleucine patch superfamily enzyme
MECQETVVDMRLHTPEELEKGSAQAQLLFKFNHTMPGTPEYMELMQKLFDGNVGEGSYVAAPLQGVCFDRIKIGKRVYLNSNLLAMARGGITIEDDVQMAANVQILTNNHDPYERQLLTVKPVLIQKGAWIGAGVTILPGISIGKHAIVGAAAVVTKDVPDYAIVVGNPAKVVKTLDADKFED